MIYQRGYILCVGEAVTARHDEHLGSPSPTLSEYIVSKDESEDEVDDETTQSDEEQDPWTPPVDLTISPITPLTGLSPGLSESSAGPSDSGPSSTPSHGSSVDPPGPSSSSWTMHTPVTHTRKRTRMPPTHISTPLPPYRDSANESRTGMDTPPGIEIDSDAGPTPRRPRVIRVRCSGNRRGRGRGHARGNRGLPTAWPWRWMRMWTRKRTK